METEKPDLKNMISKGPLGIRKCYILSTEGLLRLSGLARNLAAKYWRKLKDFDNRIWNTIKQRIRNRVIFSKDSTNKIIGAHIGKA